MDEFGDYMVAHWPRLVRVLVLLGCEPHEAEDVVQTALISCCRSWPRIRRPGTPMPTSTAPSSTRGRRAGGVGGRPMTRRLTVTAAVAIAMSALVACSADPEPADPESRRTMTPTQTSSSSAPAPPSLDGDDWLLYETSAATVAFIRLDGSTSSFAVIDAATVPSPQDNRTGRPTGHGSRSSRATDSRGDVVARRRPTRVRMGPPTPTLAGCRPGQRRPCAAHPAHGGRPQPLGDGPVFGSHPKVRPTG